MNNLTSKEIFEVSQMIDRPFADTEAIVELFYNLAETEQNKYLQNFVANNLTVKDYAYIYENLNCYLYNTIEELIESEVDQGGWDAPKTEWYSLCTDFVFDELNKSIYKMSNGKYIQFYI